jgi:hypothetical protein
MLHHINGESVGAFLAAACVGTIVGHFAYHWWEYHLASKATEDYHE